MWKFFNSPVVVAIVFLVGLGVVWQVSRPSIAKEIRDVFAELNDVVENASTDIEKSKAIEKFVAELRKQMKEGFQSIDGVDDKKVEELKEVKKDLAVKSKLEINNYQLVDSEWESFQQFIYTIKNNSDKYIRNVRVNYEFYRKSELIDVENKWLSEIKILEPGQGFSIKARRRYKKTNETEERLENMTDEIKIYISSFSYVDADKKPREQLN